MSKLELHGLPESPYYHDITLFCFSTLDITACYVTSHDKHKKYKKCNSILNKITIFFTGMCQYKSQVTSKCSS